MSFLDNVKLAYACPLRWEKLVGGERERYCAQCERHVHNLSAMSRGEAERLLARDTAPICIRVEVDAQGRAIHRSGLAAAVAASMMAACGADGDSALDSGSAYADGAVMVDDDGARARATPAPGLVPEVGTTPGAGGASSPGGRPEKAQGGWLEGSAGGDSEAPPVPLVGRPAYHLELLGEPPPLMGVMARPSGG